MIKMLMMIPTLILGSPWKAFDSTKRAATALTSTPSAKVSLEKMTTTLTMLMTKMPTMVMSTRSSSC